MAKAGTDLIAAADYGLTALDENSELGELLTEALAGESISAGDLERVKWPTGAGPNYRFERTVLGNPELVETIEGVIVHQRMTRSYWSDPEPKEGTQPDCSSPDGKFGYGDPGDKLREQDEPKGCDSCPLAAFGSAKGQGGESKPGQACKLMREFFFLTPGAIFPTIVSIPPASLGDARGYVVDLASHGISYYNVVTELRLEKATSKDGIAYAQARLKMVGKLDEPSVERVKSYRGENLASLSAQRVATLEAPAEEPAS